MTMIARQASNLKRYRIEMRTTIIFDVVMPEDDKEQSIIAQATTDYRNVLESNGGITLRIGLPDCRLYMCTDDNWTPTEIGIVDMGPYEDDEED